MRRRAVFFSPEAQDDVLNLYNHVTKHAGAAVALAYIERLETHCLSLDLASERGARREDIRPGLRIVGFERRVTVAFSVEPRVVTILRLFYGGQDWEDSLR